MSLLYVHFHNQIKCLPTSTKKKKKTRQLQWADRKEPGYMNPAVWRGAHTSWAPNRRQSLDDHTSECCQSQHPGSSPSGPESPCNRNYSSLHQPAVHSKQSGAPWSWHSENDFPMWHHSSQSHNANPQTPSITQSTRWPWQHGRWFKTLPAQ